MSKHGKRIKNARESVERTKLYPLGEAVKMVKTNAKAKFDETVELCAQPRRRPEARRPDGPWRRQPAERHRPHIARRGVCARGQGG